MWELTEFNIQIRLDSMVFVGSGEESIQINQNLINWMEQIQYSPPDIEKMKRAVIATKMNPLRFPVSYSGKFYIPGSTLKGLSRSRYELFSKPRICFSGKREKFDKRAKTYHDLFEINEKTNVQYDKKCSICKIYGSFETGTSKVKFGDAELIKEEPQVFVDKSYGTDKFLVFKPNSIFKFKLKVWDQDRKTQANILQSLGILLDEKRLLGMSKFREKKSINDDIEIFGVVKFDLKSVTDYKRNKNGILEKVNKPSISDVELSDEEKKGFKLAVKKDFSKMSKKRMNQIYREIKKRKLQKYLEEFKNEFDPSKFKSIDEAEKMELLRKNPA